MKLPSLTCLLLLAFSAFAQADPKLGIQTWSFNRDSFAEAIAKTKALGVHYIQAFPRQKLGEGYNGTFEPTMDAETRAKILDLCKKNEVEIVSFGVVRAEDEAGWRQIFEFAKAMGMKDVTVEPKAETLPLLDKLSKEYGLTVSIHNHGGNLEERLEQLKPYGPNMGLCCDTGHWVRNGRKAVESLKLAEGRIISLHMKDMDAPVKEGHCLPFGKGISDAAGQIAELKRQGFSGPVYIEYEYRTPALDEEVKQCVQFFNQELTKK